MKPEGTTKADVEQCNACDRTGESDGVRDKYYGRYRRKDYAGYGSQDYKKNSGIEKLKNVEEV